MAQVSFLGKSNDRPLQSKEEELTEDSLKVIFEQIYSKLEIIPDPPKPVLERKITPPQLPKNEPSSPIEISRRRNSPRNPTAVWDVHFPQEVLDNCPSKGSPRIDITSSRKRSSSPIKQRKVSKGKGISPRSNSEAIITNFSSNAVRRKSDENPHRKKVNATMISSSDPPSKLSLTIDLSGVVANDELRHRAPLEKKKASSRQHSSSPKSHITYSYREAGSNSPTERTLAKNQSYLPEFKMEDENELSFNQVDNIVERNLFNHNLIGKLKNILKSDTIPPLSIEVLKTILQNTCKDENQHWFQSKHKELSNANRFQLMKSPREKLLLNLVQNSGCLITPLLERLHILRNALFKYMKKHSKRTSWSIELYNILRKLTEPKKFDDNEAGLTEGIVLEEFLRTLATSKNNPEIKELLEKAVSLNSTERIQIIAFFTQWVHPTEQLIQTFFSKEIHEFDDVMIFTGMIPHIKHVCVENRKSKNSVSTIEYSDMVRSIKQEDGSFLLSSVTINSKKYYDHTLLPKVGEKGLDWIPVHSDATLQELEFFYLNKGAAIIERLYKVSSQLLFYKKILHGLMDNIMGMTFKEEKLDEIVTGLFCDAFFDNKFWKGVKLRLGENGKLCEQICYLLGLQPWIIQNNDRFLKYAVDSGVKGIMGLIRKLFSQKEVYAELFMAHYQASDKKLTSEQIYTEVGYFLDYSTKENKETQSARYENPVPVAKILRLYTNTCWGFNEAIFRDLHPILFKERFETKVSEGVEAASDIESLAKFEASLTKTYTVLRKDFFKKSEIKLAEIPVRWTVLPFKNTHMGLPEILSSFRILPDATKEEALLIVKQIVNFNRNNTTGFAIESSLDDTKDFIFEIEEVSNDEDQISF